MKKHMVTLDFDSVSKLLEVYQKNTSLNDTDDKGFWYHISWYGSVFTVFKTIHDDDDKCKNWEFETLGQTLAFCDALMVDRLHDKTVAAEKAAEKAAEEN